MSTESGELQEILKSVGPIAKFEPVAYYKEVLNRVLVIRRNCFYTDIRVTSWLNLFLWERRPWYAFWRPACIGFSVVYQPFEGLSGKVLVADYLDLLQTRTPEGDPLGEYARMIFRMSRGLSVHLPR